jgi:parallel beta-helix repeat protein
MRETVLSITNGSNMIVRGIVFEHAASKINSGQSAAYNLRSANIVWDNCEFRWNNWTGFETLHSSHITFLNTVSNYNGFKGMALYNNDDLLFEDVETSYNNWRGYRAGFLGWAVAGIKGYWNDNIEIRGHKAVGNMTSAIWFDTDVTNVTIDHAYYVRNLGEGIFLEASSGPITITNSIIAHNQKNGIRIGHAEYATLERNVIYNNHLEKNRERMDKGRKGQPVNTSRHERFSFTG